MICELVAISSKFGSHVEDFLCFPKDHQLIAVDINLTGVKKGLVMIMDASLLRPNDNFVKNPLNKNKTIATGVIAIKMMSGISFLIA